MPITAYNVFIARIQMKTNVRDQGPGFVCTHHICRRHMTAICSLCCSLASFRSYDT